MDTKAEQSKTSRELRKKRNGDLLSQLVDTRFFRFLIGNSADQHDQEPSRTTRTSGRKSRRQTISSQIIDVGIFILLVLAAPFINVFRRLGAFIGDRWWVKFLMGVVSGVSVLTAIFLVARMILKF